MTGGSTQRFREAIQRLTGISLPDSKVPMIEQRLRRRVAEMGQSDTETYLRNLMSGQLGDKEMGVVIDLITTNTTSFFREKDHFDFLTEHVVPRLLQARTGTTPRLKLWSAASSEGAEAFTMAMVLADMQRLGHKFEWAVLGTDISRSMVEKGRLGIYAADQVALIEKALHQRYVMVSDHPDMRGQVRMVPELRRRVRFQHLNLMNDVYPVDHDIDVIFLRNVLIYFSAEDRARVVHRLQHHLRPGGFLFVGHSEGMTVKGEGLERIRPTIFRKASS